jgi:hypothetical protein
MKAIADLFSPGNLGKLSPPPKSRFRNVGERVIDGTWTYTFGGGRRTGVDISQVADMLIPHLSAPADTLLKAVFMSLRDEQRRTDRLIYPDGTAKLLTEMLDPSLSIEFVRRWAIELRSPGSGDRSPDFSTLLRSRKRS